MKEYYLRQLNELTTQSTLARMGLEQSARNIGELLAKGNSFEDIKSLASRLNSEINAVEALENMVEYTREQYQKEAVK